MNQIPFQAYAEAVQKHKGTWQGDRIEAYGKSAVRHELLFRVGHPNETFSRGNLEQIPAKVEAMSEQIDRLLKSTRNYFAQLLRTERKNLTPQAVGCLDKAIPLIDSTTRLPRNEPDAQLARRNAIQEAYVGLAVLNICDAMGDPSLRRPLHEVIRSIQDLEMELLPSSKATRELREERAHEAAAIQEAADTLEETTPIKMSP